MAGSTPPVNKRRDRHAGHRTYGDQDEARRNRLGLRAGRGQQRDKLARLGAALLHLGKQHRRDRRHVGGLRARDPGDQIHPGNKNVLQAAAHVPQQARQEGDHGARHPGHFDQQAEEDEERHREQDEMAHALVHAPDQDHQRRLRRQREIAEDRQAERKGDRHAREHGGGDDADEEDQEVEVAEPVEQRLAEPEQRDETGDGAERDDQDCAAWPTLASRSSCKNRHQHGPGGQRRGAPGIA